MQVGTSASSSSVGTSTRCVRTGEGWAFYVRVVADGTGKPIPGAEVRAVSSTMCLPFPNSTMTITDTSVMVSTTTMGPSLPTTVENYSISAAYGGTSYPVARVVVVPVRITAVKISFPSGNITITHNYPPH